MWEDDILDCTWSSDCPVVSPSGETDETYLNGWTNNAEMYVVKKYYFPEHIKDFLSTLA